VSVRTEAAIEIGATGIRILIANVAENGSYEILDKAGKPVALGRSKWIICLSACMEYHHGMLR